MKSDSAGRPEVFRLNLSRAVLLFTFCSVLGFFLEHIDVYAGGNAPGRQGLLYGPIAPIYGLGALLLALFYPQLKRRGDLFLFLFLSLAGAVFEYSCSFFQEKLFGTVSWEYSGVGLDWDGRTNLVLAFCWGALGLFFLRLGYPFFCRCLEKIPKAPRTVAAWTLLFFMAGNLFLSGAAIWRQAERRNHLPPRTALAAFLDKTYPDERLREIFPNMRVVDQS